MEAILQDVDDIITIEQTESAFEIIECPQCHLPNKIARGTCAHCARCYEKIGSCDE